MKSRQAHVLHRIRRPALLRRLGPGLITGAADDDPSGIATYSQAGAAYGPNMLWTVVLTYPLMTAVQVICARIGRVTGKGLASNLAEVFPRFRRGKQPHPLRGLDGQAAHGRLGAALT